MPKTSSEIQVERERVSVVAVTGTGKLRVVAQGNTYRNVLRQIGRKGCQSNTRPILLFIPRAQESYLY
jgi:hypothetical protein